MTSLELSNDCPTTQSESSPENPAAFDATNKEQRLGEYRLIERIADGGSGSVHRAVASDGAAVAVKVLSRSAADDDTRLLRFYQEGRSLLQVAHPNLVRAYEIGEDNGVHYLAMELIDGKSLADHVMKHGRMKEATALRIAIQIARGLQAAHQRNIIHRDVSPKNVLLGRAGQVKLADFEFSKQTEMDLDLTVQGTGLGTPDFMSPEQFRKAKDVDARSDIYSLGATLYVMVTARLPFPGETLMDKWLAKAKNHFLPPDVHNRSLARSTMELIDRAMAADPDQRPASAEEFARIAEECLERMEKDGAGAKKASAPVPPLRWHLIFLTRNGRARNVKASGDQIACLIKTKKVNADARVAPEGCQDFRRLDEVEEFQQLFASAANPGLLGHLKHACQRRAKRSLAAVGGFVQRLGRAIGGNDEA